MPDIELERLRKLRRRAEGLQQTLVTDLAPFRQVEAKKGFLRTPDSDAVSGDVNVTTTCSCLMALALTGTLDEMYAGDGGKVATEIFSNLLEAPWMSSGLTENNAFTTTLVFRTLGFLVKTSALRSDFAGKPGVKLWEQELEIKDFTGFARKLASPTDKVSKLLVSLMPIRVQDAINTFASSGADAARTERQVIAELGRIIRTTVLYEKSRFFGVTLSPQTKAAIGRGDAYSTAHANRLLLGDAFPAEIAPIEGRSLQQIADAISQSHDRFRINEYDPAAAVVYWFVDGIARANIALPPANWDSLCSWAAVEFARQRSLVVAKHAAMMDPVAMAMSACLCARLRSLSNSGSLGTNSSHQAKLPSTIELEQSVLELFGEQTKSGIWPKYFSLFHYQEAGSNFCFTFELLEAVLAEFGSKHNRLIFDSRFVDGLELAVTWCERNRLQYSRADVTPPVEFVGWNSGGFLNTLRKDQPESWATAVVHMFLWELVDVLSRHIQVRILEKYEATIPKSPKLDGLLDIELCVKNEPASLKETMTTTVIRSYKNETADTLRAKQPHGAQLSALLFGPPGTSKTQLAKAVAAELTWPLVGIDPSHFLQGSFQNIYAQAERIFEDIADLSGVVVFFDEMDALVQNRDAAQSGSDTESRFLTTYMLPKLAALHDSGRVVFLMATNFQESFDPAIKRAGRFDLLLCMGPPTLAEKCRAIHLFYGLGAATTQTKLAGESLLAYCATDTWLEQQLELYTYLEFKRLLADLGSGLDIGTKVSGLGAPNLIVRVKKDSTTAGLRFDDAEPVLKHYGVSRIRDLDKIEVDPKLFVKESAVKRYVLDRAQSKRQ